MKIPVLVNLAILIALATVAYCAAAEEGVSGVPRYLTSTGACTHSGDCGKEVFVGSSIEPDVEVTVNHYTSAHTQNQGLTDGMAGRKVGAARYFDQTSQALVRIFSQAIQVWDEAEGLLKSMKGFREDLDRINSGPQLNKKSIELSLLDLQDQLEEKVLRVISKVQQTNRKSSGSMDPDSSSEMIEKASDVLKEVTATYNHLVGVVQQRMEAFRDDDMKIKENAYKMWKILPKLQEDLAGLSIKAKRLFDQSRLPKQELKMYLQYLKQQEAVLQHYVVEELKQFQPFNKPTANFMGGMNTVENCRQILSNIVQQLKRVDEKLDSEWSGQNKGNEGTDDNTVASREKARQIPSEKIALTTDNKSKRSVRYGGWKYVTWNVAYFQFPLIFVGLMAGCGLVFASLRRRIKLNQATLPFTIYDK